MFTVENLENQKFRKTNYCSSFLGKFHQNFRNSKLKASDGQRRLSRSGSRSKSERRLALCLTSSSFSVCDLSRVTVVLSSVFSSSNCCTLGKGEGQKCQKWRRSYNVTISSNPLLPGGGKILENKRKDTNHYSR